MDEHVGIAMSEKSEVVGNKDSSQPQWAVGSQLVYIVAYSYAHERVSDYELTVGVFLAGRRLKVSEIRMVLVRGLEEKRVVGTR